MIRILVILLLCMSIVSISCVDKDSEVIDYLKSTPATLLDLGLYRLGREFERLEVVSDNVLYKLNGKANLGRGADEKTVIRIYLDNILFDFDSNNKPKYESKAKLLCMDSIDQVRLHLGIFKGKPIAEHSQMNKYFKLKGDRGNELDESTEIFISISYGGDVNVVSCVSPLIGSDIKYIER